MSQPVVRRPELPIFQPTARQVVYPNVLSEYADSPSGSSASTSDCECCASPPLPDLATLAEAISDRGSDTPGLSSTLESQFLESVSFLPASETRIQAAAVIPHARQAKGHWLLVTLLCHRVFDAWGDQVEIRNFSVFYHATFGPGDVLAAVSRKVIRDRLTWLEATVTRDSALVATATALYDQEDSHTMDSRQVRDANQRRTC
ncbi:hypothetical protein BJX66DRAFT_315013 [Aspergillus keveii]|uniref:Thioesterase domain-containing protein n=1 Tax=Aspergillus keveii TaxID=714993 RepID=A0ABR4FPY2_9EURO